MYFITQVHICLTNEKLIIFFPQIIKDEQMPNFSLKTLSVTVTTTLFLTACGGGGGSTASSPNTTNPNVATNGVNSLTAGKLLAEPTTFKTLTKEEIQQATQTLEPNSALAIGSPVCGVNVQYMEYETVDAKGKPTNATGAVFVPTGDDPSCQGDRPIVLHAHGTAVQQSFNFAEVGNANNEAGLRATSMANIFAGQGFVVIAPNYAGYDKSKLDYHPYLNAEQQSHEMGDALKAGREVLKKLTDSKVKDNGKLFLTGYSQGGHVVLATAKYFEKINEPVTALVPMSGPYAMGAFGDAVFGGNVMVGGTLFAPLMARSYQEKYGNIYATPSELFAPSHADEIVGLLPSKDVKVDELFKTGKLPLTALFQKETGIAELDALSPANPRFAFGFDKTNYLVNTAYRANYLADMKKNVDLFIGSQKYPNADIVPFQATSPQHPLRQALKENDFRNYLPKAPVLLCGGNGDPMVFFSANTKVTHDMWKRKTGDYKFGMIDLDVTDIQKEPNRVRYETKGLDTAVDNAVKTQAQQMQLAFAQNLGKLQQDAQAKAVQAGIPSTQIEQFVLAEIAQKYHSTAAPYCMATARTFFNQF